MLLLSYPKLVFVESFQKEYAKCYSNLLISYNQNYLGQMDRQCKMQYTTLSSPGKALVSDNSISILNF